MRFRAVLIHAAHATFEDREEALNRVRMHQAPRIFGNRMIYRLVARELVSILRRDPKVVEPGFRAADPQKSPGYVSRLIDLGWGRLSS